MNQNLVKGSTIEATELKVSGVDNTSEQNFFLEKVFDRKATTFYFILLESINYNDDNNKILHDGISYIYAFLGACYL